MDFGVNLCKYFGVSIFIDFGVNLVVVFEVNLVMIFEVKLCVVSMWTFSFSVGSDIPPVLGASFDVYYGL